MRIIVPLSATIWMVVALLLLPMSLSMLLGIFAVPVPAELLAVVFACILLIFRGALSVPKFGKSDLMLLIFLVLMYGSYFYYPGTGASIEKTILISYLIVAKIIVASFIRYDGLSGVQMARAMYIFSVACVLFMSVLFFLGFTLDFEGSSRVYVVGSGNPIWFSRYLAMLLFAVIFYMLVYKHISIMGLVCLLLGVYMLFRSGARAPIAALGLSIFLLSKRLHLNSRMVRGMYMVAAIALVWFAYPMVAQINPYSISYRTDSIFSAIMHSLSNPFGHGLGSFGLIVGGEDVRMYPHNIFVEVFFDAGVFALIALVLWLYYVLKSGVFVRNECYLFHSLFVMSLVNAQFSGDLPANGYVFLSGLMALKVAYAKKCSPGE